MNDYVANGYGILALDTKNRDEIFSVYEPPEETKDERMKLICGVGTGLGLAFIARGNKEKDYVVYPSE
jgi:glucokinase